MVMAPFPGRIEPECQRQERRYIGAQLYVFIPARGEGSLGEEPDSPTPPYSTSFHPIISGLTYLYT